MNSKPQTISFDTWMRHVDCVIKSQTGLTVDDLPDCAYPKWFDEGATPATAARRAIKLARY